MTQGWANLGFGYIREGLIVGNGCEGYTIVNPLDAITADLTAFPSFAAMCDAPGSYRPTIRPESRNHVRLADAKEEAMASAEAYARRTLAVAVANLNP